MNLILLHAEDFIDGTDRVRLQGRRLKYVLEVHRAATGDELTVGRVNGLVGTGRVAMVTESALEMDVRLDRKPPARLPVTLVLALPRPKVLKRVLRAVSALGVERLVLINAYRVEKSYWASPALDPEKMREEMAIGLEQARDTVFPEVQLRPLFKPFVEDELPALAHGTLRLAAHPGSAEVCPRGSGQAVTLAVGPEGGFIPYEIEMLVKAGFAPVHCGDRILSVETAVSFLLARVF